LCVAITRTSMKTSLVEVDGDGNFKRVPAAVRNRISKDSLRFPPEENRYHLYIAYACPWASRCSLVRKLKGLDHVIGLSVVHPTWQKTKPNVDEHCGWVFRKSGDQPLKNLNGFGQYDCDDSLVPDTVNGCSSVRELYELEGSNSSKFTVPLLWDKVNKTMVNNESSEILEMFNSEFNHLAKNPSLDLAPAELRTQMKELDEWIYSSINDGVYKCGFAKTQQAYEENFDKLFAALDRAEEILSKNRYLCGNKLTLSDIRLFVTLVRFDEVYVVYFKCNKCFLHIRYPNLFNFTKEIYQMPGVSETVNMKHIKTHYFSSHANLNYYGVIPKGPGVNLSAPHDRTRFGSQ